MQTRGEAGAKQYVTSNAWARFIDVPPGRIVYCRHGYTTAIEQPGHGVGQPRGLSGHPGLWREWIA